ncbi:hypothetical protein BJY04DRAFT_232712 [Aspergillus karnatakaensis]|uniref:uncharacterized protein n=1 Tax=Aspergillus karnatakaensis TaxID=1810916 RepID=UPI003CCE0B15
MTRTILATGATGKQGGSVIMNLIEQDVDTEILAVTRDVNSASAQKLAEKSPKIKLLQGNLDQPNEIFENAKKVTSQPIWGVYSVQIANFGGKSDIEERQGKGLVDAALKNKVKHIVYSSVDRGGDASLENPTAVPHFLSKHNIELYLIEKTKGTDTTWTILRPVAFLDGSFVQGFAGKIFNTVWKIALEKKPLQVVAVSDIGFFGAQAFLKPVEYKGRGISVAGDELTYHELANVFKSSTGKDLPTTFEVFARLFMWFLSEFGDMFRWFREDGYKVDIQAAKKIHPGLKDFRTWLETESDWRK